MAYHKDGTVVWQTRSVSITGGGADVDGFFPAMDLPPSELATSTKTELNDEDDVAVLTDGGPASYDYFWGWIFPEKRDLFGFYGFAAHDDYSVLHALEASTNSFNAIGGDFTEIDDRPPHSPGGYVQWSVQQGYREFVNQYSSTGIRSLRVRVQPDNSPGAADDPAQVRAFHIYGDKADGANPDRLLFIDADTGLEYDEVQDWGDIPRGSVHDKDIYLLNNSATLAASSNVISFEGPYEASYTWYSIRDNSGASTAFSTQLTINGPISAGARYPASTNLTLRLSVPNSTDILGPHAAYLELASTWA